MRLMSDLSDFVRNECDEFIVTIESGTDPVTSVVEIELYESDLFLDVTVTQGDELNALKMLIEEWDLVNVFEYNTDTKH